MKFSIVTTLYESAPYIDEFYRRAVDATVRLGGDYEIIFVNDGSPDDSLERAVGLHRKDPKVCVIDLARNFGHHRPMMTGLARARGDFVFLLDADLEEDPELLEVFYGDLQARPDVDVIYGVQASRKGTWFERVSGQLFYRFFNLLSSHRIPVNDLTARLMTRRYVDSLLEHRERELFLEGVFAITGYRQVGVTVEKHSKGTTSYTFAKKVAVVVNALTSFSNAPLIAVFYVGCALVVAAAVAAVTLVIRRLVYGGVLMGWSSLMVSIWLLGGLAVFCIGIIGIYLSRVFTETKQRPYSIVRKVYER